MKLLVVRHGQTNHNAEHRYLGALDVPLNETGTRQANEIASRLTDSIDAVVCSPLTRARQTAEILCAAIDRPVQIAEPFRERNVGVFDGLTQLEAQRQFPDQWARNITRQWNDAPDGGETIEEVFRRVDNGLQALEFSYPNNTVLLVAHGFVAKVIRALVLERTTDFFDWQLDNGAILELGVFKKSRHEFDQYGYAENFPAMPCENPLPQRYAQANGPARNSDFMRLALQEGRKALPACLPNPPVGCVLVRDGKVVARGFTQAPGQHHAEAMALAQLSGDMTGVVAFVTLEPCSFHGRTPSCANTLVDRGVKHVFVATLDPDPRNSGAGVEILRKAGASVLVGLLQQEALVELRPYLTNIDVTAKPHARESCINHE